LVGVFSQGYAGKAGAKDLRSDDGKEQWNTLLHQTFLRLNMNRHLGGCRHRSAVAYNYLLTFNDEHVDFPGAYGCPGYAAQSKTDMT